MPSASCIFIEVSILTIQPVENIGDVLHDENVLKSYMYSVTGRGKTRKRNGLTEPEKRKRNRG